ncbi:MAG: hypothetical protein ACR2OZ_08210 [Verrucomicrobiales bacterium]
MASLKRVQAALKRYRASVLKAACEGRLVPTEAELARRESRPYEPASELIARTPTPPRPNRWNSRSKDVIPGHPALAVGNPQTKLPEGWVWSALVEIAKMESGHTPSRTHPEWWDGDVAWIGIADAREYDGRTIHKPFNTQIPRASPTPHLVSSPLARFVLAERLLWATSWSWGARWQRAKTL